LFKCSAEDSDWLALARRVGGGDLQPAELLDSVVASSDARFQLAAIALGQTNAEAAEVIAELDATTLGRDPSDASQIVQVAVQAWRKDQEETDLLRTNLAAQVEQLEASRRDAEVRDKEVSTLEARVKVIADERDTAKAVLTKTEEALKKVSAEREAAKDAAAKAEGTAADLKEAKALLEENLTLQLEAAETTARQYESNIAALRESHETELAEAHRKAEHAQQMAQAERTAREGQVEQARLQQRRRDRILGAQLLDEMKRSEDLKGMAEAITAERDQLSATSAEQASLIEALSRELDKVYGSRSWRITAPLRAAVDRLGSASQG